MFLAPRRWLLLVGGVVLASSIGFGTVWSYVRTAHCELGRKLRDTVPIGFDLQRLEKITEDLIPELRANQKVTAQLDVEIQYLQREIDSSEASQRVAKAEMARLRKSLKDNRKSYQFGGRSFTRQEVENDLETRLSAYDATAVQLDAKKRILNDRQRTLAAAAEKIRECQRQHDVLVEKAGSLKAELKLVELAQETGNFAFDHSKLAQAKELALEVEKRIKVLNRYVEGQRKQNGQIPVEVDTRPIGERFDRYFAVNQP